MGRLGQSLWDDPEYVLGTILPKYVGYDLGSTQLPFKDLFLSGSSTVVGNQYIAGELVFTGANGVIRQNTADGADTGSFNLFSGGAGSPTRGAGIQVFGNEHAVFPGQAFLVGGTVATGHIGFLLTHASAQIRAYNASFLPMWTIDNNGRMVSDATSGGSIAFAKATSGVELQSGANGRTGTFTMNGTTPVVVSNTSLAAGDQIIISRDTPAGTPGAFNLTARTNGTSFAVTGTAADTSGMRYSLVRIN